MTIQNVFFKGISPNLLNGPPSEVPRWRTVPESQPAAAANYGANCVQSKLTSLELSAGGNNTQFTLSSDQCYGVYSTCGSQISGRIMLPLCVASGGGQIYVNAKQYNRILMRRQLRAKAKMKYPVLKSRKPYMHLSRHLHAMRRSRGSGGRFLNTNNSNITSQKTSHGTTKKQEKSLPQPTQSQISEVLQSDEVTNDNRYTSRGSEVTSHLFSNATSVYPFQFNHLHLLFQPFQNVPNSGIGISMVAENHLGI